MNCAKEGLISGMDSKSQAPSQVYFPTVQPFYHHEIVTHSSVSNVAPVRLLYRLVAYRL